MRGLLQMPLALYPKFLFYPLCLKIQEAQIAELRAKLKVARDALKKVQTFNQIVMVKEIARTALEKISDA